MSNNFANGVRLPIFDVVAASGRRAGADRDSTAGYVIEDQHGQLFYSVVSADRPGGMGGMMAGDRSQALRFARRQDADDFAQAFQLGSYRIGKAELP